MQDEWRILFPVREIIAFFIDRENASVSRLTVNGDRMIIKRRERKRQACRWDPASPKEFMAFHGFFLLRRGGGTDWIADTDGYNSSRQVSGSTSRTSASRSFCRSTRVIPALRMKRLQRMQTWLCPNT